MAGRRVPALLPSCFFCESSHLQYSGATQTDLQQTTRTTASPCGKSPGLQRKRHSCFLVVFLELMQAVWATNSLPLLLTPTLEVLGHSAYLGSTSPVTDSRVPPRGSFGASPRRPRGGGPLAGIGPRCMGARGSGMGTVGKADGRGN